mgnify:CR=1 FL=1
MNAKPKRQHVPSKHLLGTQWTRAERLVGGRHFQVIKLLAAQPTPWARIRLEAVLSNQCIDIDRSDLKDASVWSPGWRQIVTTTADADPTSE